MTLPVIIALAILVSLIFYVLMGGADFGGGVWDLLATGPRAKAQRELISQALAPIWEANHVWLILVITLLFTAFPPAFATLMIALHVPLTLMLVGIVLRGAAFTFRHYDTRGDDVQRRWGRLFAIASTVTPPTFGICVGAIASGEIRQNPERWEFFSAWFAPFPIVVGFLTLALFAFLAAVYLANEATDADLREDFRLRALASAAVVFVLAWVAFFLSFDSAKVLKHGLYYSTWAVPFHVLTGIVSTAAIVAIWTRRFSLARVLTVLQVTCIVGGWGLSQYPYLIYPDLTVDNCAAPERTLLLLVIALIAGSVLLFPSFYLLYGIFKQRALFENKT